MPGVRRPGLVISICAFLTPVVGSADGIYQAVEKMSPWGQRPISTITKLTTFCSLCVTTNTTYPPDVVTSTVFPETKSTITVTLENSEFSTRLSNSTETMLATNSAPTTGPTNSILLTVTIPATIEVGQSATPSPCLPWPDSSFFLTESSTWGLGGSSTDTATAPPGAGPFSSTSTLSGSTGSTGSCEESCTSMLATHPGSQSSYESLTTFVTSILPAPSGPNMSAQSTFGGNTEESSSQKTVTAGQTLEPTTEKSAEVGTSSLGGTSNTGDVSTTLVTDAIPSGTGIETVEATAAGTGSVSGSINAATATESTESTPAASVVGGSGGVSVITVTVTKDFLTQSSDNTAGGEIATAAVTSTGSPQGHTVPTAESSSNTPMQMTSSATGSLGESSSGITHVESAGGMTPMSSQDESTGESSETSGEPTGSLSGSASIISTTSETTQDIGSTTKFSEQSPPVATVVTRTTENSTETATESVSHLPDPETTISTLPVSNGSAGSSTETNGSTMSQSVLQSTAEGSAEGGIPTSVLGTVETLGTSADSTSSAWESTTAASMAQSADSTTGSISTENGMETISGAPTTMTMVASTDGTQSSATTSPVATPCPDALPEDLGSFVLSFDDLANETLPAPAEVTLKSPYRRFWFSSGFFLHPTGGAPFEGSASPLVSFRAPEMLGANASVEVPGNSGYIGVGPETSRPCMRFNLKAIKLGCQSWGASCHFKLSGRQPCADGEWGEETKVEHEVTVIPCVEESGCELAHIRMTDFRGLTSIWISAEVSGETVEWWADDVALEWTDNSCEDTECRKLVPDLATEGRVIRQSATWR